MHLCTCLFFLRILYCWYNFIMKILLQCRENRAAFICVTWFDMYNLCCRMCYVCFCFYLCTQCTHFNDLNFLLISNLYTSHKYLHYTLHARNLRIQIQQQIANTRPNRNWKFLLWQECQVKINSYYYLILLEITIYNIAFSFLFSFSHFLISYLGLLHTYEFCRGREDKYIHFGILHNNFRQWTYKYKHIRTYTCTVENNLQHLIEKSSAFYVIIVLHKMVCIAIRLMLSPLLLSKR